MPGINIKQIHKTAHPPLLTVEIIGSCVMVSYEKMK